MKRGSQSLRRTALAVVGILEVAIMVCTPTVAFAQQASSTNYSVNEAFFGTGGQLCDPGVSGNSTNYCAKSSVGELGVGNTSSTTYQAQAGGNTGREEYLELAVNGTSTSLGALSTSTASTTTGTFSVKSYLASGYVVVNGSDPPINSTATPHTFNTINPAFPATAFSITGTEQFGINLKSNSTVPGSADPANGSFGFGVAASGYATTNKFRYVKGETIASAPKSSGTTAYTVSYLFNISSSTPAGHYTFNHIVVATSTY